MLLRLLAVILTFTVISVPARAQNPPIPHGQTAPPGPPLSPQEALRKMKVPDGFTVELVAFEPMIMNPVAMTFDEKGRIWVTESFEYPRRSPGPGKDRIKVLESTQGDGVYDKMTVFAEGLNIPSGIAVGHGGIWVANAPDILFYHEGPDGKASGKPEVVVTGFGRDDTHELPNSLTWGPDGWLYGWNGVFNPAHIKQNGKEFHFTCAIFRIHPKTREFQLFCEGTSNPWGIAIDPEGSFFASACVIDHLWHLVETGYYHRQGGPYPPFTWKLNSIVRHKHQKAAYCGIHYFDSDAYPAEYRDKLYMGNIHGNCINSDAIERDGSTYFGSTRADFLTANDAWFMPVVQKTGPDGSLYILDWYDQYHCYQDANRDPKGLDREKGRLYRVRYKNTPPAGKFDLSKESDDQLLKRLVSPNVFFRDLAQRILAERDTAEIRASLEKMILDESISRKGRLHAIWALTATEKLTIGFHLQLLKHPDASFRSWGIRAAGNMANVDSQIKGRISGLVDDSSPDVKLQCAIAAGKIPGLDSFSIWMKLLSNCGNDKVIPPVIWQNLHPRLERDGKKFVSLLETADLRQPAISATVPRVVDKLFSLPKADVEVPATLVASLLRNSGTSPGLGSQVLTALSGRILSGEVNSAQLKSISGTLMPELKKLTSHEDQTLRSEVVFLAAVLGDSAAIESSRTIFLDPRFSVNQRQRALQILISVKALGLAAPIIQILSDSRVSDLLRNEILNVSNRMDSPEFGREILTVYPKLDPSLQPRLIELLTQRPDWAKDLLKQVSSKVLSASVVNLNQVRRMAAMKNEEVSQQVRKIWGTVRDGRGILNEKPLSHPCVNFYERLPGDPTRGMLVYKNLCAQCHKMHGDGAEVGPDITSNGRSDFEQLLSNVFDPSLVIGEGYVAWNVVTLKGQRLTGLLAENSPQRVVLKVQGGKQEIIAKADVEELTPSKISLMPEQIEKQLKPQEIADLFAYICLDKPPTDPTARQIPGTPRPKK